MGQVDLIFSSINDDLIFCFIMYFVWGFPGSSADKESTCHAGDPRSIPGLERFPGEGKGYQLQYSGLENSTVSIVHGVTKSQTRLSDFHFLFQITLAIQQPEWVTF